MGPQPDHRFYELLAQRLAKYIESECFRMAKHFTATGIRPCRGIVVCGPAGIGKSHLCRSAFEILHRRVDSEAVEIVPLSAVEGVQFYSKDENASKDFFSKRVPKRIFHDPAVPSVSVNAGGTNDPQDVDRDEPVVIFIDDFADVGKYDALDMAIKTFISQLMLFLHKIPPIKPVAFVVTQLAGQEMIKDVAFSKKITIPIPTKAAREEILGNLFDSLPLTVEVVGGNETERKADVARALSGITPGYTPRDLVLLLRHAVFTLAEDDRRLTVDSDSEDDSKSKRPLRLTLPRLKAALKDMRPTLAVSEQYTRPVPAVAWDRVGGYAKMISRLKQLVLQPLMHPEAYQRIGVRPSSGLLLYGPSGCGKTLMVHALASSPLINVVNVKGPELLSKYLGESERRIRTLFAEAARNAPCVLFFDEMDSIGSKRDWDSDASGSVSERVLTTLLNEMDGITSRKGVIVIGCSNRPEAIDDALLRPGRLDQLLLVPLPSQRDRQEILKALGVAFGPDVDFSELARATVGCSGGDLAALAREAGIAALRTDGSDIEAIQWRQVVYAAKSAGLPLQPHTVEWSARDISGLTVGLQELRVSDKIEEDGGQSDNEWMDESPDGNACTKLLVERERYSRQIMAPFLRFQNLRRSQKFEENPR